MFEARSILWGMTMSETAGKAESDKTAAAVRKPWAPPVIDDVSLAVTRKLASSTEYGSGKMGS